MTPISVESMTSGAVTAPRMREITSPISTLSSRPTKAVETSMALEPSATWSRPMATQPSQSPASWRRRNCLEPLVLQRSPMEKKAFSWRSGTRP